MAATLSGMRFRPLGVAALAASIEPHAPTGPSFG